MSPPNHAPGSPRPEDLETIYQRFRHQWESGDRPNLRAFLLQQQGHPEYRQVALRLGKLHLSRRLAFGDPAPLVGELFEDLETSGVRLDRTEQLDLIQLEYLRRWERGEIQTRRADYQRLFPELQSDIAAWVPRWDCPACKREQIPLPAETATEATCPNPACRRTYALAELFLAPTSPRPDLHPPADPPLPLRIGRYPVDRMLGKGGFGTVYLGRHPELQRPVAIKVPHRLRVFTVQDVESYLNEARTLARLKHPHIVAVHDADRTEDGLFFVVSEFIEGQSLAEIINETRPGQRDSAGLVVAVAKALSYVHEAGVVHRDIKPANILLDTAGKPYLADFGLALNEEDIGCGPSLAGTLAYMSPEQARGEGHLVSGQADVFSLGVVFYQLLTGQLPFRASSLEDLKRIHNRDVKHPREWDHTIDPELARICRKALEKRVSDRYSTAWDMADDLGHFLATALPAASGQAAPAAMVPAATAPAPPPAALDSHPPPTAMTFKGLRSFTGEDWEFFLSLLPGPRDRLGIPDRVRFWKTRIEETNPSKTFRVGVMYGQSGCGKSSLMKAGVLPRLADRVVCVSIEAGREETETRLLKELRNVVPASPAGLGLVDALTAVRRGQYLPTGNKLLLVIDQFEQWLHLNPAGGENTELVTALRQCDGKRVQCVVLVREDFWSAVDNFLKAVDVDLAEGTNSAKVDLFDTHHARKILVKFGQSLDRLPTSQEEISPAQNRFLDVAVAGLNRDGKVNCVRLALFAETMWARPWIPETLKPGWAKQIGVAFLKEKLSKDTAALAHRRHLQAAQAVLKALLPEAGTQIRGHKRSSVELLTASTYETRSGDFDTLLKILDEELRLITPIDRKDTPGAVRSPGTQDYQLTHDDLVPAIRDWLDQEMKQTWHGRAIVRLQELSRAWSASRDGHFVPTLIEHAIIRSAMARRRHVSTPEELDLLHVAAKRHAIQMGIAFLLLAGVMFGVWMWDGPRQIRFELDEKGVNVQRLVEKDKANTKFPVDWRNKWRARAAHGYYRVVTDNWGQGQFQERSLAQILPKLKVLGRGLVWADFTELESLDEPVVVSGLLDLEELEFENCRNLPSLSLENLPRLKNLRLSGCYQLTTIEGLDSLTELKYLSLTPNWPGKSDIHRRPVTGIEHLHALKNLKFLGWRDAEDLQELREVVRLAPHLKTTIEEIDIGIHPAGMKNLRLKDIPSFAPLQLFENLERIYVAGLFDHELESLAKSLGFNAAHVSGRHLWKAEKWGKKERDQQNLNLPISSILDNGKGKRIALIHNEPTSTRPPTSVQEWPKTLP